MTVNVIAQWDADGSITSMRTRVYTDFDVYTYTLTEIRGEYTIVAASERPIRVTQLFSVEWSV